MWELEFHPELEKIFDQFNQEEELEEESEKEVQTLIRAVETLYKKYSLLIENAYKEDGDEALRDQGIEMVESAISYQYKILADQYEKKSYHFDLIKLLSHCISKYRWKPSNWILLTNLERNPKKIYQVWEKLIKEKPHTALKIAQNKISNNNRIRNDIIRQLTVRETVPLEKLYCQLILKQKPEDIRQAVQHIMKIKRKAIEKNSELKSETDHNSKGESNATQVLSVLAQTICSLDVRDNRGDLNDNFGTVRDLCHLLNKLISYAPEEAVRAFASLERLIMLADHSDPARQSFWILVNKIDDLQGNTIQLTESAILSIRESNERCDNITRVHDDMAKCSGGKIIRERETQAYKLCYVKYNLSLFSSSRHEKTQTALREKHQCCRILRDGYNKKAISPRFHWRKVALYKLTCIAKTEKSLEGNKRLVDKLFSDFSEDTHPYDLYLSNALGNLIKETLQDQANPDLNTIFIKALTQHVKNNPKIAEENLKEPIFYRLSFGKHFWGKDARQVLQKVIETPKERERENEKEKDLLSIKL